MSISIGSYHKILIDELEKQRISAKIMLHLLTTDQKITRKLIALHMIMKSILTNVITKKREVVAIGGKRIYSSKIRTHELFKDQDEVDYLF